MTLGRLAPIRSPRLLVIAGLAAFGMGPVAAQQLDLPTLTLDLSQRLESGTGDNVATGAVTDLAFSFLDATLVDQLSLTARGSLRLDDDDEQDAFDGPILSFGYTRQGATASLAVSATARRDEVDDLADLLDFVNDDGVIVLPDDFNALSGTGIRREVSASTALALRQNRPLSFGVSAGITDIAYEDATAADLRDSRRINLGASTSLDLGGARTVTAGLRYSALDEDGSELSETWGLDLGASANRPRGPISTSLSVDSTEDGTRVSANLGRTLAFPTGSLSGSLGIARGADGDLAPTATLSFQRGSPAGDLGLSVTQGFRSGDDDEEELATTLNASFARALSARSSLSLDARYAATDPTGPGDASRALEVGVAMRYALAQRWSLDGGLRGTWSEDQGDRESGTTVFLGLSRSFAGSF